MPVPYLGGALKGWTRKTTVKVIVQSVVNHETVETPTEKPYPANFQPMPPAKVARKPEEQRTWKWWSVIIRDRTVLLKTDDRIIDAEGFIYKIQQASDWRTSGFTKYEAIEDFEAST